VAWNQACGLYPGFEIYTMQHWDLAAETFRDLPAGVSPDWSPDGQWIAFTSCLAKDGSGSWKTSADTLASIYLMDLNNNLTAISTGYVPSWRPR
jgi:Tol biopolymer transport system component